VILDIVVSLRTKYKSNTSTVKIPLTQDPGNPYLLHVWTSWVGWQGDPITLQYPTNHNYFVKNLWILSAFQHSVQLHQPVTTTFMSFFNH